ncbi:thiamine pyrophosphate-binding protein [Caldimonas brevitalea]|uniref:Acetolactate synthase large subunit n=1 Tax=Caldimonas brevitalea TaxID=413882 RepID=A0A0G3BSL8_9BURK|nr:thiamine pyrophosphate-binding protein [Caldimonas brevitalea]AKJ29545.1 acetolactate synthase large subunit [Caldimonas brevitalea]
MKLCDAMVHALLALEVRYLFGVSGANIEHLHDAVHRANDPRLRSVLAKHESGAAFMADGYARASGTLGVCCATSGGGMLNLAAGVAEAQASAVPLLALVGQPPLLTEGQGGFQDSSGKGHNVDALQLWRAVTGYAAKISRPELFWPALEECLQHALHGRQGASALLLPRDLMDAEVGPPPSWLHQVDGPGATRAPVVSERQCQRTWDLLRAARRPVLVLGEAAARQGVGEALQSFIAATGIGVVTTLGNIAAFPHRHPQYLGCIGVAGHPSAHRYLAEQADLVIAAGTQLDAMTLGPLGHTLRRLPLLMVNRSLTDVPRELEPDLLLEMAPAVLFEALNPLLRSRALRFEAPAGYRLSRHPPSPAPAADRPLLTSEAVQTISRHLPQDVHLVFDAGNCAAAAAHYLDAPLGTHASIALGMGGMGYGVASAIGVQLARRHRYAGARRPTVVLCGDGAFLMNGAEVHTAVELGLPVLWIVFNNASHGMCATRQRLYFGNRVEASVFGIEPSIESMSRGFGPRQRLWVERAETSGQLARALCCYFDESAHLPGVLELHLPVEQLPPFAPFIAAQEALQATAALKLGGHELQVGARVAASTIR